MAFVIPQPGAMMTVPHHFSPLHTAFLPSELPPLPSIADPILRDTIANTRFTRFAVPNVQELALTGDAALKMLIIERIQGLAGVGNAGDIAHLSDRLNTNNVFSYLCVAYQLLSTNGRRKQKRYADLFEAYIGALWRETELNPACRGIVIHTIRRIFSPEVFPCLAEWQNGKRTFGPIYPVRLKPKMRRMIATPATAPASASLSPIQRVKVWCRSKLSWTKEAQAVTRSSPPQKKRTSGPKSPLRDLILGRHRHPPIMAKSLSTPDWSPRRVSARLAAASGKGKGGRLLPASQGGTAIRGPPGAEVVDLTLSDSDDEHDDESESDFEIIDPPAPGPAPRGARTKRQMIDVDISTPDSRVSKRSPANRSASDGSVSPTVLHSKRRIVKTDKPTLAGALSGNAESNSSRNGESSNVALPPVARSGSRSGSKRSVLPEVYIDTLPSNETDHSSGIL